MTSILYAFVMFTAKIHDWILTLNDGWGYYNNDKTLHFIVMGVFGAAVLLFVYWVFSLLKDHMWIIAFIYTFTVMVVLAFAIEIGQGYYGTGAMEMDDVVAGLAGFLAVFVVVTILRFLVLAILRAFKDDGKGRHSR